jgi:phosphatidylinositol alpha-1,6-mannosyltransferase
MRTSPRILVLQQGAPGGIGRIELFLQRALLREGPHSAEVRTVSRHLPHDRFTEASEPPGADFTVVHDPVRYVLRSLREAILGNPDVIVYTHVNVARLHVAIRCLRPRTPAVLLAYGVEIWQPLSRMKKFALHHCDRIVTLTRFVADTIEAIHGPRHAPIVVVPAGLSDGWAADVTPRRDPTGQAVVLTVARLDAQERKGVDLTIEAFPRVLERVPDAVLRIVGEGSDRPRLERLAASLGLDRRVHFVGAVDDATLKRLYATADVFTLPSIQEGFGLVYLEAMAHGLPCVVVSDTAAAEVVEAGVTGLGVPAGRVDELSDAVSSLLLDRERWRQMSRAASACFHARYREAAFARRIRAALLGAG